MTEPAFTKMIARGHRRIRFKTEGTREGHNHVTTFIIWCFKKPFGLTPEHQLSSKQH